MSCWRHGPARLLRHRPVKHRWLGRWRASFDSCTTAGAVRRDEGRTQSGSRGYGSVLSHTPRAHRIARTGCPDRSSRPQVFVSADRESTSEALWSSRGSRWPLESTSCSAASSSIQFGDSPDHCHIRHRHLGHPRRLGPAGTWGLTLTPTWDLLQATTSESSEARSRRRPAVDNAGDSGREHSQKGGDLRPPCALKHCVLILCAVLQVVPYATSARAHDAVESLLGLESTYADVHSFTTLLRKWERIDDALVFQLVQVRYRDPGDVFIEVLDGTDAGLKAV